MKPALQIIPLAFLTAGAVVAVWRGFDDPVKRNMPNQRLQPKRKRFWQRKG